MIKLLKTQVAQLREIVNEFDEQPIGPRVYCVRVTELKYRTLNTPLGPKNITLPQDAQDNAMQKQGGYPQFSGVVVAKSGHKDCAEITNGDIVRFSPLDGEIFTSTDGDRQYIISGVHSIRGISGNIFQYEGEDNPEEAAPLPIATADTTVN